MTGTIKTLKNGFGFIAVEGKDDLFFHVSELAEGVDFDSLQEGQAVSFEEGSGPKGPMATNVALA
jgi:CspA family cold shock protein